MSADEKKKAIGKIIKLIEEVSEKELEKLKELKNSSIDDIAKAHTDAFGRIFDGITDVGNYHKNYLIILKADDEDADEDAEAKAKAKKDAFDDAMAIFKDAKIKDDDKNEVTREEKEKVLALFEAILEFYKDDEKKNEFKNLEKQVDEIKKELKDAKNSKSKVIFDGDRCYQVTDGDDGSVNVRFKGLCDKKEERDEVSGGRKRKSRRRKRKSKRKLRRKNRKSERKNRKSRRKSIKR